ncbi:kinase-regulated stress-responsive transcription factor skn7 [Paramecium bursaria]
MKKNISSFILKTYNILEDSKYQDIVSWSDEGKSFTVWNIGSFTEIVLPAQFKHNNFSSFVRQLNMYDFHKSRSGNTNEFRHPQFQQGRKDLLYQIKRKCNQESQIDVIYEKKTDNKIKLQDLNDRINQLGQICGQLLQKNHQVLKQNKTFTKQILKLDQLCLD